MPRKPASTAHMIPESGRIASTFSKNTLKAIRKLGIDLEMPDTEVVHLAVTALIERYYAAAPEDIARGKAHYFVEEWPPRSILEEAEGKAVVPAPTPLQGEA